MEPETVFYAFLGIVSLAVCLYAEENMMLALASTGLLLIYLTINNYMWMFHFADAFVYSDLIFTLASCAFPIRKHRWLCFVLLGYGAAFITDILYLIGAIGNFGMLLNENRYLMAQMLVSCFPGYYALSKRYRSALTK